MSDDEQTTQDSLFPIDPEQIRLPDRERKPVTKLSRGRKLTQRLRECLAIGRHPVTGLPLHTEAAPADDRQAEGRRCGSCALRWGNRYGYPKCHLVVGKTQPYTTHGAATDIRAWWPACEQHEYPQTPEKEEA